MREKRRVFETSVGVGRHRVYMMAKLVGEDVVAIVSGGDKPHVGAVAVAIPRPSLKGSSKLSSTSSVFTLVGHKDDEVARSTSEALARELNKVAVVSAGIHIGKASEEDIRKLAQNAEKAVKNAIEILLAQK